MNNRPEISTAARELADLGQRLVRFGYALQQDHTTATELTELAGACGIHFQLRTVADHHAARSDTTSNQEGQACA